MSYWGKDKKKKRQAGEVAQNGQEVQKNEIYEEHTNQSVEIPTGKDPDINFNEDESSFTTFLIQTKALMWKNSLLIRRKSTFLPFLIMTPFVVGFLLDFIMVIGKVLTEQGVLNPKIELTDKLVACQEPYHFKFGDSPCLTVGYGIIGEHQEMDAPQYSRYHDLMKIYAKQNDFEYGKDIKALTVGNSIDMQNYLTDNLNKTQFAVMFCHEHWREELEYTYVEMPSLTPEQKQNMTLKQLADLSISKKEQFEWEMPCKFDHQEKDKKDMYAYFMIYNYTLGPDNLFTRLNRLMRLDDQLVLLKTGIDNAILEQKAVATGLDYIPKIKQELQSYPYVPNRILRDIDVVSMYGAFYIIMVPLTVFMLLLDELVREKVDNLRKGMQLLGTLDSAYWASWILTGVIMNAIISLGMILVGRFIYQFEVFLKTPWYVWFGMLFMNTQAYISLACFLSTVISSKLMAFSVNFSVILTSFVECMVLSEPTMMKKVFFNLNMPQYMKNITYIFYLNPCFQTAKMFGDITNTVSAHFDSESFNWIKSDEDFHFEDIWRVQKGKFITEEHYLVPSIFDTGISLIFVIMFYFLLTFYFDSILPDNRGVPQPWYFLISPFYWFPFCFSKSSDTNTANQNVERYLKELLGSKTNKTVSEELKRVSQEEKGQKVKFIDGVRAINLSKSFQSLTGTSNVQALKNVTFDIKKGELLGIMGHNGAGKSTLINVLCGLVYKDQGIARNFGLNIDDNLTQIRKRMGVVSQFDVLWDELTGIEHMHLFQILKRVEIKDFDRLVKERLGEVGLKDAGSLMVGKYSGGMRRRISVALSTMGDPDILLMDEPTTGMDPVSRRHVWQLVQKMKMDKAIIMSTHAMEEAELLSDKIIVLDNGELKCVGTPFQLKSSLGKGYRISMICGQDDTSKVKKAVQKILPSSIYQESSGDSGGLVFDLPFSKIKELGPIFGLMSKSSKDKQKSELADMVTDVGVSQTSLEEVFMAVTGHEHQ